MAQTNFSIMKYILTALLTVATTALVNAQPQVAYDRGLEELYRGNTTQALDIWYQAYERDGGVDSRIGFEFIRVVTEEGMKSYYEDATRLYYRALVDADGIDSRVAMRQEVERMRPLVGDGVYRQWMDWWEDRDRRLGPDIRGYWVQEDPTPSRDSNERLIEHWERIAEARQRFNRNSRTIYGTDERALIYIRYGEPDRSKNGILTIQNFNIQQWLQNQLNPYTEDDSGNRSSTSRDDMPTADRDYAGRLMDAIYEFHRYPEYEVWFYESIGGEGDEPVPFIFGTDIRSDEFRLQRSVEDFIPERAYHPDRAREQDGVEFTRVGITPALMLQMLYYEQLVDVDPFFNERLNSLRDNVLEQGIDALRGMDLAFKAESREKINQRALSAPRERSTYSGLIPRIPFDVYQYRFLDEDGEPYLLTYIESDPQEAFMIDFHRNRSRMESEAELPEGEDVRSAFPFYELIHSLQQYDENWNRISSDVDEPPIILSRSSSDSREVARSMYRSEHKERVNKSASAELMNYDPDTRTVYETPFNPALRGLNRLQFRVPEPLVNYPDSLEMADLVLGFESERVTEPFSFQVANNALIPSDETLVLHFEVYNLERRADDTQFTEFELTYRILPVDENGETRTDQAEFVLTLNFTNEYETVIEDLEIETADLRPGLYDLRVHVTDTVTGQEKEREIRFEVID
ncbi:MAG: GWxTD domain-containing protein [Balneolaceae bacterium]|nr:GWxTD domain-containing protein [Balneolaceae bacterium]MCH8548114.1 GWxTD domain-containing protein [Balneolaceae bacterium]